MGDLKMVIAIAGFILCWIIICVIKMSRNRQNRRNVVNQPVAYPLIQPQTAPPVSRPYNPKKISITVDNQHCFQKPEVWNNPYIAFTEEKEIDNKYVKPRMVEQQFQNSADDIHSCNLVDCPSLFRLVIILRRYKMLLKNQTYDVKENFSEINDEYNTSNLLNDYNHLLLKHSSEFESVYQSLNANVNGGQDCRITECLMLRRNHRDRNKIRDNKDILNELYFFNKSSQQINNVAMFKQQLLDRIHCYFLHSLDTGYKLTQQELKIASLRRDEEDEQNPDAIDKTILDIYNLIQTKKESYRHRADLTRLTSIRDKFSSNLNQNKLDEYSYGWRYFYWDYYKNNKDKHDQSQSICHAPLGAGGISDEHKSKYDDGLQANAGSSVSEWYTVPKYSNFKQELTQNEICTVAMIQWDVFLLKARCLVMTELGREMKCVRQITARFYEMDFNDPVTTNHLIAMLVYCNCSGIQFKFSETYRKIDQNETFKSLRSRHSNYYFWGRLLRELAECYGMKTDKDIEEINVFHGVIKLFSFSSLKAYIKGPCSTTTDYVVAANFCHNSGLILEFKMAINDWAFKLNEGTDTQKQMNKLNGCFDCQWISDFSNEQEIFCIGGANFHVMQTIIIAPKGINYQNYIQAIISMTWGMTHGEQFRGILYKTQTYSPYEIQLIYRLMSHELFTYKPNHKDAHQFKSCSDYVSHLLHSHCKSISTITFWSPGDEIKSVVFKDKSGWIKLSILNIIFPNVTKIWIKGQGHESISLMMKPIVYDSMLQFVSKQLNSKLKIIEIIGYHLPLSDTKYVNKVAEYVDKYKQTFCDQSWSIKMEIRQHDDGQIYLFSVSFKAMN